MKTLTACVFALAMGACSAPDHTAATSGAPAPAASVTSARTSASTSEPASTSAPASAPIHQNSDWQLLQGTSPMDGRELVATKTYKSDDGVEITVSFKCLAEAQHLHIEIDSIVGDPKNPSQRSSFQRHEDRGDEVLLNSRVPILQLVGRIRFGSLRPEPLNGVFNIDSHFANSIVADISPGANQPESSSYASGFQLLTSTSTVDAIYSAYVQLISHSHAASNSTPANFNSVAGLSRIFPIETELVNGAGTYDISIPYVAQIATVLQQCGGNEPVLSSAPATSDADP